MLLNIAVRNRDFVKREHLTGFRKYIDDFNERVSEGVPHIFRTLELYKYIFMLAFI
jgi:hypothetical protein